MSTTTPINDDQAEFVNQMLFMIHRAKDPYPADLKHRDTPQDRLSTFVFGLFPELEGAGGLPQCRLTPKGREVNLIDRHLHDTWPDVDDDDIDVRTFLTAIRNALEIATAAMDNGMDLHTALVFLAITIARIIDDGYELRFQQFDDDTWTGEGDDIAPHLHEVMHEATQAATGAGHRAGTAVAGPVSPIAVEEPTVVDGEPLGGAFTPKARVEVTYRVALGDATEEFANTSLTDGSGVHLARKMVLQMGEFAQDWITRQGTAAAAPFLRGQMASAYVYLEVTISEGLRGDHADSMITESVQASTAIAGSVLYPAKALLRANREEMGSRLHAMKADQSEGAPWTP